MVERLVTRRGHDGLAGLVDRTIRPVTRRWLIERVTSFRLSTFVGLPDRSTVPVQ